jgi:predicted O-methyltransferase YrrM
MCRLRLSQRTYKMVYPCTQTYKTNLIKAYLRYAFRARTEHGLHSPFVFDLYTQTIRPDNASLPAFCHIQTLRSELLASKNTIQVTDFGAGSRLGNNPERRIADIVKNAEKPARFGRLLYRLIRRFESKTVVELGTSLGLTTAYLAAATQLESGQVVSFEGCPETAAMARQNLAQLSAQNVTVVVGNIDETLTPQMATLGPVDLAFFDANHRYQPTLRYFETCLPNAHNDTCFVFDDIHWSPEMERAWVDIQAHPSVTVTIDLFWVGLVFFRKQQAKEHFVLRF